MSNSTSSLTQKQEWRALEAQRKAMDGVSILSLFQKDPARFEKFSVRTGGVLFDYSKHRITEETVTLLCDLARACDVQGWQQEMFSGEKINTTEDRAVLHTALRRAKSDTVIVDGEDVIPFVHGVLDKMRDFSESVRSGVWTGYTGKAIERVIHIGIGGSDLGPRMVCTALRSFAANGPDVRFVSNIDGADITSALADAIPETTLFIVASKTFTTQETMVNAATARKWLIEALGDERSVARHFVALSTNVQEAKAFGIPAENMFAFEDWVGGRYSLWSAIGLPVCLSLGFENFRALLDGAQAADRHFCEAPLEENIPVLMALLGIWYRNFWDAGCMAVLPYAQDMEYFPAWLQQLDMESSGKTADRNGDFITDYATGPVIFGQPGTNGQHAFYQLLHQGTDIIPCDFIGAARAEHSLTDHHALLLGNMIAQSRALMEGRASSNAFQTFAGNRPSSTILLDRLDPYHLGFLCALYEHKVFVQGVIWNINSFDQFGVELGKIMARDIEQGVTDGADSSTLGLLAALRTLR